MAASAATGASGSPPWALSRMRKRSSPVGGSDAQATDSMLASGGASAGSLATKRSTASQSPSTSSSTPRSSLST